MCLVIDANTFASIFDPKSQEHSRFVPVLNWVTVGKGRIVYGGTKYKRELKKLGRYLHIISQLSIQGRVIVLPSLPIDRYAAKLKARIPSPKFDDEHLVAIVAQSNCRVVCSDDKRAYPYLRRQTLYPKNVKRPKIYSSASHVKLCCDEHLTKICRAHT